MNHDHEDDDVTEDDIDDEVRRTLLFRVQKKDLVLVMAPLFFLKMTFVVFVDIIMTSVACAAAFWVTASSSLASMEKDAFSASKVLFSRMKILFVADLAKYLHVYLR